MSCHLRCLTIALLCCLLPLTGWARSMGQDAYDKGAVAYQQRDYFAAAGAFHQATVLDPGMLRAWRGLGWAWRKLGRNDDALRIWHTLLKIEPDHPEIITEIGAIERERGNYPQAIARYQKSLSLKPAQPQLHLVIGDIYQDMGALEQAVEAYRRAAQEAGLRTKAQMRIAALYEASDQPQRAIDFIKQQVDAGRAAVALRRHLARLYADRAKAAFDRQQFAEAAVDYQRAAQLQIDAAPYYAGLGWVYRQQGALSQAIEAWRRALAVDPTLANLNVAIADAYRDSGEREIAQRWYKKAYEKGDDSVAIFRMVESALLEGDQLGAAWWAAKLLASEVTRDSWVGRLAQLYIDQGHADWGIHFLTQVSGDFMSIERNEAVALLYVAQGDERYRQSDHLVAEAYYSQALVLDPDHWGALRDLGWVYWQRGRWRECATVWARLIEIDSLAFEPHNLFTQYYMELGDYRMAIAHAKRSLELNPDQPRQRLRLARSYYLSNQFEPARAIAKELARGYPEDLPIQKFQAQLYSRYREYEAAKRQWGVVLRLDPDSLSARKKWLHARYALGEYDEAIAGFRAVLAEGGADEKIYHLLATNARSQKNYGEAALWFEKLVEHWPERVGYWLDLAQVYADDAQYHFAHSVLVRAQWHHGDSLDLVQKLANNYAAQGQHEEALALFRQIQQRAPSHRASYVGMVYALTNTGRFSEALAKLDAPEANQFWKDYEITLRRATILAAAGEVAEAESLRRAVASVGAGDIYVPILLYHGLGDNPRDEKRLYVGHFDAQLAALQAAGYTSVTVSEFLQMLSGALAMPERPVLITFDDARRDSFERADPLLAKYGFNATMFVSTAEIMDDHPFHLDWTGMRDYQKTGRWDFHSHGHNAHKRIIVDEQGRQGSFLVNRKWLADKGRLESEAAYRQRLDEDYRTSVRILQRQMGGEPSQVYAYPYSETGQQHMGNEAAAYEVNLALLQRHFRFGAVQDQSGYNFISAGRTRSPMLRRFNVPYGMDGEALLRHLKHKQPQNIARLALAKSLYWRGEYDEAERLLLQLDSDGLAPKAQTQYFLAAIAYQAGRYRDAAAALAVARAVPGHLAGGVERLDRRVQWQVRPSLTLRAELMEDSNDRTTTQLEAKYLYPLHRPVALWLSAGSIGLQELGYEGLDSGYYDLGLRWRRSREMAFSGSVRARSGGGRSSLSYWLRSVYRGERVDFTAQWGRGDVNTLRAYRNALQANRLTVTLAMSLSTNWRSQLVLNYRDYGDGNDRSDARAALIYALPQYRHWRAVLQHGYSDSGRSSDLYYTPSKLNITELLLRYRHSPLADWLLEAELGAGWATGDNYKDRATYRFSGQVQRDWGKTIQTSAKLGYQNTTTYDSWSVGVAGGYLF